jgi:hypothetical protein
MKSKNFRFFFEAIFRVGFKNEISSIVFDFGRKWEPNNEWCMGIE